MDCLKKILPGFAIVTQPKVKTPFENRINLMVPILKNKNSAENRICIFFQKNASANLKIIY